MLTLGIHGGFNTQDAFIAPFARNWLHDAAAALCRDGDVLAAAEEERFLRVKHVNYFPLESIKFCLEHQSIGLEDIDQIAVSSFHSEMLFKRACDAVASGMWDHRLNQFDSYCDMVACILQKHFSVDVRDKIALVDHQLAHAQSAISLSGFSDALVVVLDAWGDQACGVVGSASDGTMKVLRPVNSSFGAFYTSGTCHLGYRQHDEYKVMGLAPYGDPERFREQFRSLYEQHPDGACRANGSIKQFEAVFGQAPPAGKEFDTYHKDFAAGLQAAIEDMIFHLVSHFSEVTGHRNICLAGGVAQNSSANGKILNSGLFDDVFVQPAAYDAGLSIGSALHVSFGNQSAPLITKDAKSTAPEIRVASKPHRMEHAYLGSSLPDEQEIIRRLESWKGVITYERAGDIYDTAAKLLADGQILGWTQGRSEFGPRALGNRSILADPRPAKNKDIVNAMVKKREGYRPFAPAVMEEALQEYFITPNGISSLPFMTFVVPVCEDKQASLGAVTHVDGTARVQTVSWKSNERFWNLLAVFERKTGIPILLNTSFNTNSEPIVDTFEDAMNCFLVSGLDHLVVGDILISKACDVRHAALNLAPRFAPCVRLVERLGANQQVEMEIHDAHRNTSKTISPITAQALRETQGELRLRDTPAFAQIEDQSEILDEIVELWSTTSIVMASVTSPDSL